MLSVNQTFCNTYICATIYCIVSVYAFSVSRVAIQVPFSSLAGNTIGNVRLRKYELSNSEVTSLSACIVMGLSK